MASKERSGTPSTRAAPGRHRKIASPRTTSSASLLSADIHPIAIVQILFTRAAGLAAKLGGLGPDRELASLSAAEASDLDEQNRPLWSAVGDLYKVGATRTSKLLASKRANLIPIYDSVIGDAVYGGSATVAQWQRMHAALTADGGRLQEHLLSLRGDAGLPEESAHFESST